MLLFLDVIKKYALNIGIYHNYIGLNEKKTFVISQSLIRQFKFCY